MRLSLYIIIILSFLISCDNDDDTVQVTSITVNLSSVTVVEGNTVTLTATVEPTGATDQGVTWLSSDNSIATVSASGVVTGIGAGNVTITVITDDGGFSDSSSVTVDAATVPVTGITVNPSSESVTEGSTVALTATVEPTGATDQGVTWLSSDNSIATVSASGVVTGVGAGNVTITATTDDGGFTSISSISVNQSTVSTISNFTWSYIAYETIIVEDFKTSNGTFTSTETYLNLDIDNLLISDNGIASHLEIDGIEYEIDSNSIDIGYIVVNITYTILGCTSGFDDENVLVQKNRSLSIRAKLIDGSFTNIITLDSPNEYIGEIGCAGERY